MRTIARWTWSIIGFIVLVMAALLYGTSSCPSERPAKAQAARDLVVLAGVLAEHYEKHGQYPADEQWLDGPGIDVLKASYEDLPLRDPWGMDYIYYKPSSSKRYILGSRGPDRKFGMGPDDPSNFGNGDDILTEDD